MLLCTIDRVLDDLGFVPDNMKNIKRATIAALNFAEHQIASALGTGFAQRTMTDTWFIRRPNFEHRGNLKTVFRLSQGFVNSAVPFAGVAYTKVETNFVYDEWFDDEYNVLPGPDKIDISQHLHPLVTTGDATGCEKGVVVDTHDWLYDKWVKITYQCGFPLAAPVSPETVSYSYDLTVVPEWLQTAAHLAARITLQSNPSLEDPAIKLDTNYMQRQLDVMLRPHVRYVPYAQLPDR
jgi:hypothetical protein